MNEMSVSTWLPTIDIPFLVLVCFNGFAMGRITRLRKRIEQIEFDNRHIYLAMDALKLSMVALNHRIDIAKVLNETKDIKEN
jgi:hypothetical protein